MDLLTKSQKRLIFPSNQDDMNVRTTFPHTMPRESTQKIWSLWMVLYQEEEEGGDMPNIIILKVNI